MQVCPTLVGCGFHDSLIFRAFIMFFGLFGLSGPAGAPTGPCCLEEEGSSQTVAIRGLLVREGSLRPMGQRGFLGQALAVA